MFSINAPAPEGMTINATTGQIDWTPSEAQGAGYYPVTVELRQTGNNLSPVDSVSFEVQVLEENNAPVLAPFSRRSVEARQPFSVTASATDPDSANRANRELVGRADFDDLTLGTWRAVSVASNKNWTATEYDGRYAEVFGYGGDVASEDWLISPALNLSGYAGEVLTFLSRRQYTGPALDVLYSTNYAGTGNPNSATWTSLTAQCAWPVVANDWSASGTVDLSGITGSAVSIAFRYKSTGVTNSTAAMWDIDNIVLTGTPLVINNTDRITYSLGAGAPAGMMINPTTGLITWTPSYAQAAATHQVTVIASDNGSPSLSDSELLTVEVPMPPVPGIIRQPLSAMGAAGQGVSTGVGIVGPSASTFQWYRGGRPVSGATAPQLSLAAVAPADVGIYDVVVTAPAGSTMSTPAVIGVLPPTGARTAGAIPTRTEWQDIHHPNGAVYDQFLLSGWLVPSPPDRNKIARCSYLDENESIVQVEMSGAGAITIVLDNASGPMAPALYNQSGIQYMKGKATIVLAGSDATTHFTVYSVGTATNPGVTRPDVPYAGWADVAAAGIVSTNSALGGIHQGNVNYNAALGATGFYAPEVTSVGGLVVLHGITASASAVPYLYFGARGAVDVKIAGTALAQPNGDVLTVSGLASVTMGAGQDSCGRAAPAQAIATRLLKDDGTDVTAGVVTGP
ncbi:MAG: putative Ig domain-containing protein [Opitutaceae bacterium]|nr:putative Ig domain-containing protein [Opitutaceae bacterium]